MLAAAVTSAWQAAGPSRAGVVVRFEDGAAVSRCVDFEEPTISGYELLSRSGLLVDFNIGAQGGLVCSIEGTGCPIEECWCQCQGGGECVYWSYWRLAGDEWRYAQIGAMQTMVGPGEVDGWSWGPGTVEAAVAPPTTTFADVCAEAASARNRVDDGAVGAGRSNAGQLVTFGWLLLAMALVAVLARRRRRAA